MKEEDNSMVSIVAAPIRAGDERPTETLMKVCSGVRVIAASIGTIATKDPDPKNEPPAELMATTRQFARVLSYVLSWGVVSLLGRASIIREFLVEFGDRLEIDMGKLLDQVYSGDPENKPTTGKEKLN